MEARFLVGIDLGTTHTVVASAPVDAPAGAARVFEVPQLVAPGEVAARPLFPSSLYAPLEGEMAADPFGDAPWVLGEQARRRGAEVPGRLVASSKSWLAHAGVDRTAPILPWGTSDDVPRLSPVDAAARLLAHVRAAWDARQPGAPLAAQDVVLTVPASFDEVARELTLEGARRAGLAPRLLEEPQAAFYDWMARAGQDGLAALLRDAGGASTVLVVDIGGGTTDLSLVRVTGASEVTRVAVGPHVLLGGDNMDLALAHACEPRLTPAGERLDAATFGQLTASCRVAKEALLGAQPPDGVPVTVLARGAALVGGARSTRLGREEAEALVLEGFFPLVAPSARPQRTRGALLAFGLPFERDVAITRHVGSFLARHLPGGERPDAVLLNGGVFRSARLAERLVACLAALRGAEVRRLPGADPDLAVARGAVAYAAARRGRGVRIGGGTARGYYVGVAGAGAAGPSAARAVCVVPRGADEGQVFGALGRTFALATGRPVRFDVYASDEARAAQGDVVEIEEERFDRLPPLCTEIGGAGRREVRVSIEGELTAVGTLDLACVEVDAAAPRRFRLAFQLRDGAGASAAPPSPATGQPLQASRAPARQLEAALDRLDRAFGKPRADAGGREAKDLLPELERLLTERSQWTTAVNRALFDALVPSARARRRSADHERVFWLLAGFCVRPGFGDPHDPRRIAALAPLFDERLAFPAEARGWQQFFIAWRRAAGGLDESAQVRIRDFVDPHLAPAEAAGRGVPSRRPKKPALALDDAMETASSLERVPPLRRAELGGWILERTWTDRDPRLWAAIGRLGARVPAYASAHHVVAPHVVERWLDHLLREKWGDVPSAAQAAARLARRTGDRARDIAEPLRREVERRLVAAGADDRWVRGVREVVTSDEQERAAFFGDALPLGLRLVD
ncbi:MAG: Hsp70 family protein [Myxococcales bacterium]|nr:Hsp70 family protein [Myxococcales bacterium]